MTIDKNQAADDLAFLRTVIEERPAALSQGGFLYAAAGIIYGIQCLISAGILLNIIPLPNSTNGILSILANVLFLGVMTVVLVKNRQNPVPSGLAARAITSGFMGAGLANLVLAITFGIIAYQRSDFLIWLLFPAIVCALQGAVWFSAMMITRQKWLLAVAIGWFATAMVLGISTDTLSIYLLTLGGALLIFMTLPGIMLMRLGKQTRP